MSDRNNENRNNERMPMSRRVYEFAFMLTLVGALQVSSVLAAPPPGKDADSVVVGPDQMHQLKLVPTEIRNFHMQKPAVGQIAFNEDASTIVLTPFSGRVTRLIAKIGDEVRIGDPLFEIDSPEVVQAQTDLIAAVQGVEKARSQIALAKRALDRQLSLLADKATSQREVDQARNDYTIAESDLATAQGALTAARNRLRVIVGARILKSNGSNASVSSIPASRSTHRSPGRLLRARSALASSCGRTAAKSSIRLRICR